MSIDVMARSPEGEAAIQRIAEQKIKSLDGHAPKWSLAMTPFHGGNWYINSTHHKDSPTLNLRLYA